MNYPDDELVYYLNDKNEIAQDEIYNKHKNIIDIYLNKYRRVFYALNIDLEEARQEANLGFSYAIYNYDEEKDATLSTFINLCVDRRLRKLIRSYETTKNKIISETVSLNNTNSDFNLEDIIGDEKYEPLRKLEGIDTLKYINSEVKNILSNNELEVYNLLIQDMNYQEIADKLNKTPKQIDNTIQRIRIKLKNIE